MSKGRTNREFFAAGHQVSYNIKEEHPQPTRNKSTYPKPVIILPLQWIWKLVSLGKP